MGLPTELRLNIYEHHFNESIKEVFLVHRSRFDDTVARKNRAAILRVCKTMHEEATGVFCSRIAPRVALHASNPTGQLVNTACYTAFAKARDTILLIHDIGPADCLAQRVVSFLRAIDSGRNLQSLHLLLNFHCTEAGGVEETIHALTNL